MEDFPNQRLQFSHQSAFSALFVPNIAITMPLDNEWYYCRSQRQGGLRADGWEVSLLSPLRQTLQEEQCKERKYYGTPAIRILPALVSTLFRASVH